MATSRRSFTIVITPLRLASEANRSGKFRAYLGRKSAVKAAVASAFEGVAVPVQLPVTVTLTRLGGRKLDPDNLANSFKHVQDGVAAWLGIDDGDIVGVEDMPLGDPWENAAAPDDWQTPTTPVGLLLASQGTDWQASPRVVEDDIADHFVCHCHVPTLPGVSHSSTACKGDHDQAPEVTA